MFYKVIENDKVIDVLSNLEFIVHQKNNNINVIGKKSEAFGVLSSDSNEIYAVCGMKTPPDGNYRTVTLAVIDSIEYESLNKELNNSDSNTSSEENPEVTDTELSTTQQGSVEVTPGLQKFFETVANSDTNSIAKIRQAAQQYLDDTATPAESG